MNKNKKNVKQNIKPEVKNQVTKLTESKIFQDSYSKNKNLILKYLNSK